MELSKIFDQFPSFYYWVKEKKLNSKDLTILTEFKKTSDFKSLLQWIEKYQPSHSQGVQILDFGGELLLMNKVVEPSLLKNQKASSLIESLKKLRLATSSFRDEEKSNLVKSLAWTASIKAKWNRQNDRGALSIHFDTFSLKDFKQKIQKLNSIYDQLNQNSKKLWRT